MVVPRSILAPFMAVLIEEIGYGGNFKATYPAVIGMTVGIYIAIWHLEL